MSRFGLLNLEPERAGRTLLPASSRTRGHSGAPSASWTDPGRPMLVVRQQGAAAKVPSVRQVSEAGTRDQEIVEKSLEGL